MTRRDEEKKRRRQKRLQKRAKHQRPGSELEPLAASLGQLERVLRTPAVVSYPGGRNPSLARPDTIKFELAIQATDQEPGSSKLRHMEEAARRGLLGDLPDFADHWVTEEFLWHGVPGDTWHPVDSFLAGAGARFPPAAAEQMRHWKAAEIGLFDTGEVRDDLVTFQPWDPIQGTQSGPPLRAISLNIGGVNVYRQAAGGITLTYLAPWVPEDNLYCAMGYGKTFAKSDAVMLVPYLGLRHPEVVCRTLPWKLNRPAADGYLRQWRQREWHGWLRERLRFPFWALVGSPQGNPELRQVTELLPSTPQQAQQLGIYLMAPFGDPALTVGGTMVEPIDVTSPNALALAEYHAYRKRAGPPPGTRDLPPFTELR